MKKRITSMVLLACMLFCACMGAFRIPADSAGMPSRVINVVYDDSGSMIRSNGAYVDTWCQAKYAMEVFAAMLEQNDTMNVYCMSDFENGTSGGPKIVLKGADGTSANVAKVHNMITAAGNTPFDSVRAAYNNLKSTAADEKWLVVLTDGAFQGVTDMDGYFAAKSDDVRVMFLGMGPEADGIQPNESKNIYFEKANNSKEILNKITGICTRVFNSNKLSVDVSQNTVSFDVPMGELTVFAQGANVAINGIKTANGELIKSSTAPVTVKYSEKATTSSGYAQSVVDKSLVGSIVTFKGDFAAGNYTLDVTGAETVEVYYKPNIQIAVALKDKDGNPVTDLTALEAGDYKIEFYFVKSGTQEKVPTSKLLGDVTYTATVTNNGKKHDKTYASGDSIHIEEGELQISVQAKYLTYNSVSTELNYTVYKNKAVQFELLSSPKYTVKTNSIVNGTEPLQFKVTIDGKDFTDEQWKLFALPTVKLLTEQKAELGDFKVEKAAEKGIINVYPTLKDGKTSAGKYGTVELEISSKTLSGNEAWTGQVKAKMEFDDQRSWFEQNRDVLVRVAVSLAVLLLILGYIPPFKKYLPRKLKRSPLILCEYKDFTMDDRNLTGRYEKSLLSTLIPYRAERGEIRFATTASVPKLKIRAKNKSRMIMTNCRDFNTREDITFNGETLVGYKHSKKVISAGVTIQYITAEATYTCTPGRNK